MGSAMDASWVDIGDLPVYLCRPPSGKSHAAVILLQEIFGVNNHMRSLAARLAREGYVVAVPDLFFRQGKRVTLNYDEAQKGIALMQALKEQDFLSDMAALLGYLKNTERCAEEQIGVLGFCMGGRLGYLLAASEPVGAAVCFYGARIAKGPVSKTVNLDCPILLVFGGKDDSIPKAEIEAIRQELKQHDKEFEIIVYPQADHGFFCEDRQTYDPQAAIQAWETMLDFFDKEL